MRSVSASVLTVLPRLPRPEVGDSLGSFDISLVRSPWTLWPQTSGMEMSFLHTSRNSEGNCRVSLVSLFD